MGHQFVDALKALKVGRIRVCSLSAASLEGLAEEGIEAAASGGVERLEWQAFPEELGIIATPISVLIPAAKRLASFGFRRLLIEKPVSLWSRQIEELADAFEAQGVDAVCAYTRVAHPSFVEACARATREGGITSCTYTLTEMIQPDWPSRFTREDLARWGVANSLHVISMAHALIGMPEQWQGYRQGRAVAWHPTGSVFVGSGVSERGIPFSYHADWGSTGRWSVEVHTAASSYRFCPLETLQRRVCAKVEWEPVPITAFAPEVKVGFVEQVAAMLSVEVRSHLPLVSLRDAASLARLGEAIFGYADA
jgi:predicted dehydrogenase